MKKTTAFFLTIGVLAMIIGGIGSAVYFRRAEQSMTDTKRKLYNQKQPKSKGDSSFSFWKCRIQYRNRKFKSGYNEYAQLWSCIDKKFISC
ncbi:hypothetical protein GQR36_20610 [Enterococcus termitis]